MTPIKYKSNNLYVEGLSIEKLADDNQTPFYCYSEKERINAISKLGDKAEITRFKGLGEISPDEFKNFIGDSIRLDPVIINRDTSISDMLSFYMGKNTPERQKFIINNLKIDIDKV